MLRRQEPSGAFYAYIGTLAGWETIAVTRQ